MRFTRVFRRGTLTAVVASSALLLMVGVAGADDYQAQGIYFIGNGTTTTSVSVDGDQMTVRVEASGMSPNLVHAQHIHGEPGVQGACPALGPDTDADGDGFLSTAEGVAQYGTVKVALTTEGDTGPDSALAVERFPVADDDGSYVYERTFTVDPEVAANVGQWVVINHGVDLDDSGEYDGDARSSLTDDLPLEATIPASCGVLEAAQVSDTPVGGVAAGGGGTAAPPDGLSAMWFVIGGGAVAGVAVVGARRRLSAA